MCKRDQEKLQANRTEHKTVQITLEWKTKMTHSLMFIWTGMKSTVDDFNVMTRP